MSKKSIPAPCVGSTVLYHSRALRAVVPATVQKVVELDLIVVSAVDMRGDPLRDEDGYLPSSEWGETVPGVPAAGRWCWPWPTAETIEVDHG